MRIQTYTIVAGTEACNAKCPFCVSRMTPKQGIAKKLPEVNWRNFEIGCQLAENNNVSTVLITSKGENTLYPDQITYFLDKMEPRRPRMRFPLKELQTNGLIFDEQKEKYQAHLKKWFDLGLTTVAISIAHYLPEKNHLIYNPHRQNYIDLPEVVETLHNLGYSVRLATVMLKDFIDKPSELENLIDFAKQNNVEQLSVRPVRAPKTSEDPEVLRWTQEHQMSEPQIDTLRGYLDEHGTKLMNLMHGAVVYDVKGQNVCLTDCLTLSPDTDEVRQLIFFPDGHLRYDWVHQGAILL